jgi:hypothetical protein
VRSIADEKIDVARTFCLWFVLFVFARERHENKRGAAPPRTGAIAMGVMLETISLAVRCSCCGGSEIEFRGEARDDAEVICPDCGASLGDWAEVKEQARAAMADALRDDFQQVAAEAIARRRTVRSASQRPVELAPLAA